MRKGFIVFIVFLAYAIVAIVLYERKIVSNYFVIDSLGIGGFLFICLATILEAKDGIK